MNFYIIPTPIGNLEDLTLRSKNILKSLDFLVVENKNVSIKLLNKHSIDIKKILIYNDNSSEKDRKKILSLLKTSIYGGVISDAGTPLISDPGFKLVRYLLENNVNIISLPGANSITTALVGSGLPTNKFQFLGFAPKQKDAIKNLFKKIISFDGTSIFFESPLRVHKTLIILKALDKKLKLEVCLAKELTKINEKFIRGNLSYVVEAIQSDPTLQKGEFVLLISAQNFEDEETEVEELYEKLRKHLSVKDLSLVISTLTGINKNQLYKKFLQLSKKST